MNNKTINGKTLDVILKELQKPFPAKYQEKGYKNYISVNSQYYINRLDDVLGMFNYNIKTLETKYTTDVIFKTVEISIIYDDGTLAKVVTGDGGASFIYPKDTAKPTVKPLNPENTKPTVKPLNPENTNDSATSDAIKRACKKLRIGLDLFYQNRKISNKPNASEELEELYKKYGNGRTSQPQNTIETFKLIFKTPLVQGSRNSYNATVVDAENNEYTLIIWSNKVNELKSRGIFEDLLRASQLRQKFTVKGTLQIYGPKREEQIIFEEVFVKNE